jgi:hypothetical protein
VGQLLIAKGGPWLAIEYHEQPIMNGVGEAHMANSHHRNEDELDQRDKRDVPPPEVNLFASSSYSDAQLNECLPGLRKILVKHFNLEELYDLCFDLRVDHETLPIGNKNGVARELVAHMERNDQLHDLVKEIRQRRPRIDLPC